MRFFSGLSLFAFLFVSIAAHAADTTEWTLLLFMNGKNDLEDYVDVGLQQIEQVAHHADIRVVVQAGKLADPTVKRFLMKPDNDPTKITSPVLQDLGPVDMGDHKVLQDFIHWGVENFPSKHYILVLWDHGYGWHGDEPDSPVVRPGTKRKPNDISTDETTGNTITTEQMTAVIADFSKIIGRKVDIVATDACFMASLEVAYEIAPYANFYLGSEEIIPVTGWPYHHILENWAKNTRLSPDAVAKLITDEYVKFHEAGIEVDKREVVYSAMNLSKIDAFVTSLRHFSEKLLARPKAPELFTLGAHALRFAFEDYVDLGDLAKRYQAGLLPDELALLQQVQKDYQALIYHNRITPEYHEATGASIWMPIKETDVARLMPDYRKLKFAAATGWDRVIELMFKP